MFVSSGHKKQGRKQSMTIEQLYDIAASKGIEIDDVPMRELRAVSFPEGWIAIDKRKFCSEAELKCELAHEIGHCETGSFYRGGAQTRERDKNERSANFYAAELLLPMSELMKAMHGGILFANILARMYDVTKEFAEMVLELYDQELCSAARTWSAARKSIII